MLNANFVYQLNLLTGSHNMFISLVFKSVFIKQIFFCLITIILQVYNGKYLPREFIIVNRYLNDDSSSKIEIKTNIRFLLILRYN